MKVEIELQKLIESLKILDRIKEHNGININADADEYTATIVKQNDNTTIISRLKFNGIYGPGRTTIPYETAELIKKIKSGLIIIAEDEIIAGNKSIEFDNSAVDYQWEEPKFTREVFRTTEKELHRMLEVKYAVSHEEIRPILTGVCFNDNETCALDGYRLSLRKGSYSSDAGFVLNGNTVAILDNILDPKQNREVDVFYDKKLEKVKFKVSNTEIIGNTIPGEFIKYRSIIPNEDLIVSKLQIDKFKPELDFINDIKTSLLKLNFTEDKLTLIINQYREEFDKEASIEKTEELRETEHHNYLEKIKKWNQKKAAAEKNKKRFSLKEPIEKAIRTQKVYKFVPIAQIKSEVECSTEFDIRENEFMIAVNPKYLIEAIKQYADKVKLKMCNLVSPIIITEDGENLELVLPIRLTE